MVIITCSYGKNRSPAKPLSSRPLYGRKTDLAACRVVAAQDDPPGRMHLQKPAMCRAPIRVDWADRHAAKGNTVIYHCAFKVCHKAVEYPEVFMLPPDGWAWLSGWGPGVKDGMYCKPHASALEELLMAGGLNDVISDDPLLDADPPR
jgi:hypothetical protein